MHITKYFRKIVAVPITMAVLFTGINFSEARVNPFSNIETLNVSDAEKAAYIDAKTTEFFNSIRVPETNYVVPDGWKQEILSFNGVPVEKFTYTATDTDRVILFIHGGGYVGGLNNIYRDWGIHKAELAGNAQVLMVDYRLAPQYLYPSALEDAVNVYKDMLDSGYSPDKIILMGDSAGGNLSLALSVYLRDNNIPQPKAIVLISPWTYVGVDLPSRLNNIEKDKMLGIKNKYLYSEVAKQSSYAGDANITDPYLSPAYADLTGISPMLIIAGGNELLLDDAALVTAHAKAAGVDITEKIYPGMSHDWDILLPELPESKVMNEDIAQFINKHLQ